MSSYCHQSRPSPNVQQDRDSSLNLSLSPRTRVRSSANNHHFLMTEGVLKFSKKRPLKQNLSSFKLLLLILLRGDWIVYGFFLFLCDFLHSCFSLYFSCIYIMFSCLIF